jgi:predicted nucleic-acid-binding protein
MRALDTNVLIRFVTTDDENQAAIVERLLDECHRSREHLFISIPVICELVWVLKNGLRQTRAQIVIVIDHLVEDDLFQIDQETLVARALDLYRHGRADFADYLIGQLARDSGCRDTVTFDKTLRGAAGFTLL